MVDRTNGNRREVRRRAAPLRRNALPRVLTAIVLVTGLALAAGSGASGHLQRSSAQPRWILFTGTPAGIGAEQVFRITLSGKGLRQLTRGNLPSEAPAFSPNAKRVAFARLGAGVFSMNLDGTRLRRLTTNGRDSLPAWSPDGRQIAFVRPFADGWRLYVMSASGAGEHRLRLAPAAGRPSWTAAGLVIPTAVGDLARVDPRSGRVLKLYGALIDASSGLTGTAVSPDLSTTTFVGPRPPTPGDKDCGENLPCPRFGLYLQDLRRHKAPRMLARDAGPATFSPDGKSLAFVARNRIFLRLLRNGTSRSVPTGKVNPTTSAPPAWQPG
jgi:Tol biopolymer transport system component